MTGNDVDGLLKIAENAMMGKYPYHGFLVIIALLSIAFAVFS